MGCGLVTELHNEGEDDLEEGEEHQHHEDLTEDEGVSAVQLSYLVRHFLGDLLLELKAIPALH